MKATIKNKQCKLLKNGCIINIDNTETIKFKLSQQARKRNKYILMVLYSKSSNHNFVFVENIQESLGIFSKCSHKAVPV